ncbi:MAG: DUF2723 domain-containing protein [Candidatus Promineifilaceae bacterium]
MSSLHTSSQGRVWGGVAALALFFTAGLALSRLLYEGLFPSNLWLGRPLPALLLAAAFALVAAGAWRILASGSLAPGWAGAAAFLPLLLNLFYLFQDRVDLAASRFLFAASLWLCTVFLGHLLGLFDRQPWSGIVLLWLALLPAYLLTMPSVVGRADTFEFQVVIPQLGIAHPTGYPLYILLGRLFAALPFGSVAWRINLASAIFATLAATMLYLAGRRLWRQPAAALIAAVVFGLSPTFWSQAVQAEVYALNALIVASVLWLIATMLTSAPGTGNCNAPLFSGRFTLRWQSSIWLLALLLGLGLANHLTTVILFPPAVLAVWLAYSRCLRQQNARQNTLLLLKVSLAFVLPLLLYAYLPLRWSALHGAPMGMDRFLDWVIGGRFQGALQLDAWLNDFSRYRIVGRLLLGEWGWFNLFFALIGFVYAVYRDWRAGLILLLALLGYLFYGLNYHVPDLAVFLIPAQVIVALFWGAALAGAVTLTGRALKQRGHGNWAGPFIALLILLLLLPTLLRTFQKLPEGDYTDLAALQTWGEGVLSRPLADGATILADSEKIAPLYYLQQAEGQRPDLNIMVLPDEAAYRTELDARLAAGETVYLARFLPGLAGIYHLRSMGPLLEVSREPILSLPDGVTASELDTGELRLRGYKIVEPAPEDPSATAVTLYWQAERSATEPAYIYLRWSGPNYEGASSPSGGAHPAGDSYPTIAFEPGEIVADFHLLPRPDGSSPLALDLQVATGPRFATAEELTWHTIASETVQAKTILDGGQPYRAQNGRLLLNSAAFPDTIRPGTPLPLVFGGYAPQADVVTWQLLPADQPIENAPRPGTLTINRLAPRPLVSATAVATDLLNGPYLLYGADPLSAAACGWLAPISAGCVLGEVSISGIALPPGAVNFEDKIALLDVELPQKKLEPGGVLPLTLRWQSLAAMDEDYTIFVQVLDADDRLVGQVDAWPLQGTYPTSQWSPGEQISDPYQVQLSADMPPGEYRLQVGLYLLSTLRRLPVIDAQGQAVDDKVVIPGLLVE